MVKKVCSVKGCPRLTDRSRCKAHDAQADRARGSSWSRGYDGEHRSRFRAVVLARDPVCVRCGLAPSTHADHFPLSRRQLVAAGLDPNDPENGRGLCASCHSSETTKHQPGGFLLDR